MFRNYYYEHWYEETVQKLARGEGVKTHKKSLSDQFNINLDDMQTLETQLYDKYDKLFRLDFDKSAGKTITEK